MSEALKTPELQNVAAEEEQQQPPPATDASPQVEKKTPGKRTRLSFIERAQKESEELVKNLGGSLEMEGGRRTRSSARGTPTRPVATPPPAKKSRNSPASPKAATPRGRGRGRKLDTSVTPEPPESKPKAEQETEKTEADAEAAVEKEAAESEKTKEAVEKSAEAAAATKETNGPEKTESENVEEDAPEKVQSSEATKKKASAVNEDKKAKAAPEENKAAADQVDASKLESVKVKPADTATEVEKETKKLEKPAADSPMEVDEHSNPTVVAASSKTEKKTVVPVVAAAAAVPVVVEETAAAVEPVAEPEPVIEKQPTPEPMEVDSSSKSSDVVECTDVVDKAEEETAPASTPNDIKSSTNSHAIAEPVAAKAAAAAEVPVVPAAANNIKSVTANDIPAVKSIVEPVGQPHIDNNKNENDVDQQKLAAAASQLNDAIPTSS